MVAGVNAHDAKKQRANIQAGTDRLDLMGIASMLLNRRANCSTAQSGIYRNLRTLVRHRRKFVSMSTKKSFLKKAYELDNQKVLKFNQDILNEPFPALFALILQNQ